MFMDYVHFLRRTKKISQKATEVLDFMVNLKEISYADYYKRYFKERTDESKRRYLKKFTELKLVNIIEEDGKKISIKPNLDVLKTLRRIV